jgi:DNA-binding NarL/FixJ family response regulator
VTVRCLLVDDNRQFLAAARALLEVEGLVVVGAVSTAADAGRWVEQLRPDVALVDIGLGAESGFDVARDLAEQPRPTPVILFSTHDGDDYADLIAASPAIGFLPKTALSARAVRDLLTGDDPGASADRVNGSPGM